MKLSEMELTKLQDILSKCDSQHVKAADVSECFRIVLLKYFVRPLNSRVIREVPTRASNALHWTGFLVALTVERLRGIAKCM